MQSDPLCDPPRGIFIDDESNVYSLCNAGRHLSVWWQRNQTNPLNILIDNVTQYTTLFVSAEREAFFETTKAPGHIVKRYVDAVNSTFVAQFSHYCFGLFIDLNNTLYCSLRYAHQVEMASLAGMNKTVTIRAGNGSAGATSWQLDAPWGIFVDTNFDLYVADSQNNRIQRFRQGSLNGTTVAGSQIPFNLSLNNPTDVVLDASGNLYIADNRNSRIVRVTPTDSQCLLGCSGGGSNANQFSAAYSLRFDSHGNLFVADEGNRRIQKFYLIHNCQGQSLSTINRSTLIHLHFSSLFPSTSAVFQCHMESHCTNRRLHHNSW